MADGRMFPAPHLLTPRSFVALGFLALSISWVCLQGADQSEKSAVFAGPIAEYEQVPPAVADSTVPAEVLRFIWVEERMNVARRAAPVRVPVFLAAGECRDPAELELVRWPSRERVPGQWDDVRRGADGGVARLHLWCTTDLGAGESQRWALVRRSATSSSTQPAPPVEARVVGDKLQIKAGGMAAAFFSDVAKHGPLASLQLNDGPLMEFADGGGASVAWSEASGSDEADGSAGDREMAWGTGLVFAKVRVQSRYKNGSAVTQEFRVFSDGTMNIIQTVKPTDGMDEHPLAAQEFLTGRLTAGPGLTVHPQAAGIVDSLADFHHGYAVDAVTQDKRQWGWLVVPGSLGGVAGRVVVDRDRQFHLRAPGNLSRVSGDARPNNVKLFWSEVTLIPARRDGDKLDRAVELAASQPLVAVVERPGVTLAMATARLQNNVREMKPVGWVNETVIRSLQGKPDPFPRKKWTAESDPATWVAGAQRAAAKVMGNTVRPLAEDEKGRAAGSLDPYHITYESTALAHWLLSGALPEPVRDSVRARMEAVRRQLGRTDEGGWPYLDVFSRTQNMQMGPPLLTLADAGSDFGLRRFYRDQLSAPTLSAVMLRGLRPYQGRPQKGPSESDTLYQSVVDFMLRATELSLNESLGLQPVAFGRYLDAIDVNADLYHPAHPRTGDEGGRFARANFFRTQSHLHRWLAWGPAPFVALLRPPPKDGLGFPGATEAWQFANVLSGRWKNWPDQSWLFLASVLPEKAGAYSPAPRPSPAKVIGIKHASDGNRVSWEGQSGVSAYRIYRLRPGSSPMWLNSPYREGKPPKTILTEWLDADGIANDDYRVHGVNAAGQESAW